MVDIEIDQKDFDLWIAGDEGREVFAKAVDVFEREGLSQTSADYLIGALRIAFRKGFICGRTDGVLSYHDIPF